MSYGTRYLKLTEFIRYCEKLKIKTSEKELEHYEKENIMLPSMRVLKPEEYVRQEYDWLHRGSTESPSNKWPDMSVIYDNWPNDDNITDEQLIDSFDREINRSSYLVRPNENGYKPWKTFEINIQHDNYRDSRSTVDHYYSYWQAHQLYLIQQFPDLYQNYRLIIKVRENLEEGISAYPRAFQPKVYRNYKNQAPFYDALSFFITMYTREQKRTFAPINQINGYKTLTEEEHQRFLKHLSDHAKFVKSRFSLRDEDLYSFLVFLLGIRLDYQDKEKTRLANEIESDIAY
jgi:hypothetical protein